ncbi:MAG: hypothetical protein ABIT37_24960 [Luteolibacter sp.]
MYPILRPCCRHVRLPRKRAAGIAGWTVPGLLLILMPKCPACFAAYIALGSGIGLSLPVAASVRTSLIVLCVASLVFMISRQCRRWIKSRSGH